MAKSPYHPHIISGQRNKIRLSAATEREERGVPHRGRGKGGKVLSPRAVPFYIMA